MALMSSETFSSTGYRTKEKKREDRSRKKG